MRFWDSSAVVPLVVSEAASSTCLRVLHEDQRVIVWALTPVEILSAIHRRTREGALDQSAADAAMADLATIRSGWDEILDVEIVRPRAERLLAVHALRAADALQLAAALIASDERPQQVPFVCLDERLRDAARAEGFRVLPSE